MQLFAHSADGVLGWLEKIVAENCNKNLDKKNWENEKALDVVEFGPLKLHNVMRKSDAGRKS